MNDKIGTLLRTLNIEVHDIHSIKGYGKYAKVYYIADKNKSYILKIKNEKEGKKILPFKRFNAINHEVKVHSAINSISPVYFRLPELIATDHNTFMLTEYVENCKNGNLDESERNKIIVRGLIEFQFDSIETASSIIKKSIFLNPFGGRNKTLFLIKRSLTRLREIFGLRIAIKIFLTAIKCNIQQKKIKNKILLHKCPFWCRR